MAMKVLICNPPWKTPSGDKGQRSNSRWPYTKKTNAFSFPVYLAYAAALCERDGFEVSVIDAVVEDIDAGQLAERVKSLQPKVILLETATPSINLDYATIDKLKAVCDAKIAVCGAHVTVYHAKVLEEQPKIDYVIRGEFEMAFLNICKALRDKYPVKDVKGISYRQGEQIIINENSDLIHDMDSMPFPAYHLFDLYAYGKHAIRLPRNVTMVSSKGCPHRCTFCVWPQTMYGHAFRPRSAKNVVDEMEMVVKKYGAQEIFFDDDTFTIINQRVNDICDEIIKRGLKVRWQCYAHVNTVEPEMLKKMYEAGCYVIRYGIESGHDDTLKAIKKGSTIERIRRAIQWTKEAGIKSYGTFMLGLPGDTKQKCEQTINFACELDPDFVQFSIVTPFPGTELYNQFKQEGRIEAKDWAEFNGNLKPVYELPDLSREDMKAMLKKAWRSFYLRPHKIWQTIKKIDSFGVLVRTVRGGYSIAIGRL